MLNEAIAERKPQGRYLDLCHIVRVTEDDAGLAGCRFGADLDAFAGQSKCDDEDDLNLKDVHRLPGQSRQSDTLRRRSSSSWYVDQPRVGESPSGDPCIP
jgi:hypothetical protein